MCDFISCVPPLINLPNFSSHAHPLQHPDSVGAPPALHTHSGKKCVISITRISFEGIHAPTLGNSLSTVDHALPNFLGLTPCNIPNDFFIVFGQSKFSVVPLCATACLAALSYTDPKCSIIKNKTKLFVVRRLLVLLPHVCSFNYFESYSV